MTLKEKLAFLFGEITYEKGQYGSRYGIVENNNQQVLLHIATHCQLGSHELKKDVNRFRVDKIEDFRYFDKNDKDNKVKYKDEIHQAKTLKSVPLYVRYIVCWELTKFFD